ncbi:hypothetical protein WKK05_39090 (plasmid) [Nostoc sp. UHCC 0302]|uniref:hypothetical protein n=1 Tax=Nostoc sp. UHCC 0302 TaxID=3134896 RepID=UPI00311C89D2
MRQGVQHFLDFPHPTPHTPHPTPKSQLYKGFTLFLVPFGYDVHVFAPGFSESDICNPLDFLIDNQDAQTAHLLASSINKYFWRLNNNNSFFDASGEQLTKAILMLTKEFGAHSDILTATAIIKSEYLVKRLINANLNPWIKVAFGQLFSCAESPLTTASVVDSACIMFSEFMVDRCVPWLIGKSTLPLKVKERQMIIFGINQHNHAVAPLIFSIFELLLTQHIALCGSSLIVAIDQSMNASLPNQIGSQQIKPIIILAEDFNQEVSIRWESHKNMKLVPVEDELALRAKQVDQRFLKFDKYEQI